jgi:hypothetical protein
MFCTRKITSKKKDNAKMAQKLDEASQTKKKLSQPNPKTIKARREKPKRNYSYRDIESKRCCKINACTQ